MMPFTLTVYSKYRRGTVHCPPQIMDFTFFQVDRFLRSDNPFRWVFLMHLINIVWIHYHLWIRLPLLRPPRGVHQAHLQQAYKPCYVRAVPPQTYENVMTLPSRYTVKSLRRWTLWTPRGGLKHIQGYLYWCAEQFKSLEIWWSLLPLIFTIEWCAELLKSNLIKLVS